MKWIRIIALHFEKVLEYRLKSFIWLLIPIINNLTLILFWASAYNKNEHKVFSLSSLATYYFLMTIVGALLVSHIEFEMSEYNIKQGDLVNYLLKPISFYWYVLIEELPYRVIQGFYAIILFIFFSFLIPHFLKLEFEPLYLPLIIAIFIMGYILSYTYKMCLAFLSFWFTEIRSLHELSTILIIILSGGILPLPLYPNILQTVSSILPFAYSGYYPIIAIQKKLSAVELLTILGIQVSWYLLLRLVYSTMWKNGVKKFTAVGQ